METKLEIAKKWLNENSDDLEAFKKLVYNIVEFRATKIPQYFHNLTPKTLSLLVKAFFICFRKRISSKYLSLTYSSWNDKPLVIHTYYVFEEYFGAVKVVIQNGADPKDAIWRLPTDVNSFNDSIQYLRENITEEEINWTLG